MSKRINISLEKNLVSKAKQLASLKRLPFSSLVAIGLENLLKSEGFIPEDEAVILKRIAEEVVANGFTLEEFEAEVAGMLERKVCCG